MEKFVAFPSLNLEFNIDPVAFSIGGKEIYWYGVIVAAAFLLSAMYAMKRSNRFGVTSDDIIDCLLIAAPIAIVCARLYYVAFEFNQYKDNLWDIFKIWEGGIAIYGGVIGGALGIYIFCKWKKKNFLSLLDLGACSILLGQSIGRWGNFVNVEAYGYETSGFMRMVIDSSNMTVGVHPTFLYESVWNLLGFAVLYIISKKFYKFVGQISLSYMIWYGFGRFFIEGLRTDSLWIGGFRISQVLALATCIFGTVLLAYFLKKTKNNNMEISDNDNT